MISYKIYNETINFFQKLLHSNYFIYCFYQLPFDLYDHNKFGQHLYL